MNVVINQHLIILPGPDFDLFIETRAMYRLEDYIKMFQPAEDDKAILLYGSKYKLWLLGTYIDTATCVHDDHLGVTFQNLLQ